MLPEAVEDGNLFQANGGIYVGALDSAERTLLIRQESMHLTAVQYAPSSDLV